MKLIIFLLFVSTVNAQSADARIDFINVVQQKPFGHVETTISISNNGKAVAENTRVIVLLPYRITIHELDKKCVANYFEKRPVSLYCGLGNLENETGANIFLVTSRYEDNLTSAFVFSDLHDADLTNNYLTGSIDAAKKK